NHIKDIGVSEQTIRHDRRDRDVPHDEARKGGERNTESRPTSTPQQSDCTIDLTGTIQPSDTPPPQ
ncbi:4392_t:CDS:1, partial [Acaulospora morrowiae]